MSTKTERKAFMDSMAQATLQERFIQAKPEMMRLIGITEALIYQAFIFESNVHDGEWVKLSVAEWVDLLGKTVTDKTMRTKLKKLEHDFGLIESRNTGEVSRVKEYRLVMPKQ